MKKINSRAKGQRGERQWRDQIRAAGWQAERGVQFAGGPWSPDVRTNMPFHFEVKAVEKLNLESACVQAETDARGEKPWIVAHKRNCGGWKVTMAAETFFSLCRGALAIETPKSQENHSAGLTGAGIGLVAGHFEA
jgi:hypothetical protein